MIFNQHQPNLITLKQAQQSKDTNLKKENVLEDQMNLSSQQKTEKRIKECVAMFQESLQALRNMPSNEYNPLKSMDTNLEKPEVPYVQVSLIPNHINEEKLHIPNPLNQSKNQIFVFVPEPKKEQIPLETSWKTLTEMIQ